MDEKEILIKNELKKSLSDYEIKTQSQDIINAYNSRTFIVKEKSKKFLKPLIAFSFCTVILCAIIPLINITNHSSLNNLTTIKRSKEEQTAFSLFSAISFIDNPNLNKKSKKNFTNDDFKTVVTAFDNSYDIVLNVLNDNRLYETKIENEEYSSNINSNRYSYKLTLKYEENTYSFYTNLSFNEEYEDGILEETETEFFGELEVEGSYYETYISLEEEVDGEKEVEMEIKLNEYKTIKIEQEIEKDEIEYQYKIVENDETIYEENLKFNRMKNNQCSMEIKDDKKEFSFDNICFKDKYLQAKYHYNDFKGSFTLEDEESKIYKDEKNNFEIKIQ